MRQDVVSGVFFFALVWSVGASCDLEGRRKFNARLREMVAANGHGRMLPAADKGSVYDYCYLSSYGNPDWCPWMATRPEFKLDPKTPFDAILVPTVDTLRSVGVVWVGYGNVSVRQVCLMRL